MAEAAHSFLCFLGAGDLAHIEWWIINQIIEGHHMSSVFAGLSYGCTFAVMTMRGGWGI
jgi:uncharacterized membrane protein